MLEGLKFSQYGSCLHEPYLEKIKMIWKSLPFSQKYLS